MKKLSVPQMVSALWSNKKLRYISLAVTALAVAGAAMTLSSGKNVAVMPVSPQLLEDSFWEDGVVRAQTRSVVSTDLSGKVDLRPCARGTDCKKRDVLLVLDTAIWKRSESVLVPTAPPYWPDGSKHATR